MAENKPVYRRVMLKISGEVLEGEKGEGIDFRVLDALCAEIAEVKKNYGVEVVVVIGGGNFWRSRDFKGSGIDRVHSDYIGMLATVMNSLVMQHGFEKVGVRARPLSAISMPQVVETFLRDKALKYMAEGEVLIAAGGTGNPFFTTDSAAALRALELECDVLLKATKVDYVYDKDPVKYPDAKAFESIRYDEILAQGLEVMDLSAVGLCANGKLPIIVFNLKTPGNIARAISGEKVGTKIS